MNKIERTRKELLVEKEIIEENLERLESNLCLVPIKKKENLNKTPEIVEMFEKPKDEFEKEGDRLFALVDEKHKRIQELHKEIANIISSYIDLVGEERRKQNKKTNGEEINTKEDNGEEAEYKNIDKIGFSITMDSNVDELLSEYGKECIRHGMPPQREIRYSIESAGIRFPISEESGKAIAEKWIYLLETQKNGNK